ncbi:hypothetical protein, partial [Oribacterium sinus]
QNNFLSNIGLKLGHALASLATYRILSEKLRFSCFSQVPTGSDYPRIQTYIAENFSVFFDNCSLIFFGFIGKAIKTK